MNKKAHSVLYKTAVAGCLLGLGYVAVATPEALAQVFTSVAQKAKVISDQQYIFGQDADARTNVYREAPNSKISVMSEETVSQSRPPLVDDRVLELMKQGANTSIKVNVALNLPEVEMSQETPQTSGAQVSNGSIESASINGRAVSENVLEQQANTHARQQRAQQVQIANIRAQQIKQWAVQHGLENKEGIEEAMNQSRSSVTLNLTVEELQKLIQSGDKTIDGIELYEPGEDTVE